MKWHTIEKFKVRTEDHKLKVIHDPEGGGYEFELTGYLTAFGDSDGRELVLEVETEFIDPNSGLPNTVTLDFNGRDLFDLVDQVLEWATEARLLDEQLEHELSLEP